MRNLKFPLSFALFLVIGLGAGLWLALDSTDAELQKGIRVWAALLPLAVIAAVIGDFVSDGEKSYLKSVLVTAGVLILGLIAGFLMRLNLL